MTQEEIDKATDRLGALKKMVGKWADEACEAGDAANSAVLRRVEGHLTMALAEGRCMTGGIQPRFGGK